jgi:hypothetical protein
LNFFEKKDKSFVYNKRTLVRNKGDKDYTKSEKHLLISHDYSLFVARDSEIIQMHYQKIVKKISETLLQLEERSNNKERRIRTMA